MSSSGTDSGMTALPVGSVRELRPQLENLRSYWLGWGSDDSSGDTLPIYRSGVMHGLLNGVLQCRHSTVDEALSLAHRRLADVPHVWWIGDDSEPGVLDELVRRGARVT